MHVTLVIVKSLLDFAVHRVAKSPLAISHRRRPSMVVAEGGLKRRGKSTVVLARMRERDGLCLVEVQRSTHAQFVELQSLLCFGKTLGLVVTLHRTYVISF